MNTRVEKIKEVLDTLDNTAAIEEVKRHLDSLLIECQTPQEPDEYEGMVVWYYTISGDVELSASTTPEQADKWNDLTERIYLLAPADLSVPDSWRGEIPEPQGLGAVVTLKDGRHATRYSLRGGFPWILTDGSPVSWNYLTRWVEMVEQFGWLPPAENTGVKK